MILLTGGAGFIGSCFLKALNDRGITDILIVDSLKNTDKWKNLVGKKFVHYENKIDFRHKLLKNPEQYKNIDTIFHLGACSRTTERNADYLLDNNYNYSKNLAQFAVKNNSRFIYASSAATYGNGEQGYNDNIFDTLQPLNCYGFTKHIFDQWVLEKGYAQKFVGLKYFNVFGPNEYHKEGMASMVLKAYNQISETKTIKLFKSNVPEYEDGGQLRDFIYVKDVVNAMLQIYDNDGISGIYNLGTGNARSWNDLANAVFKSMNLQSKIEYIYMPDDLKNQYQNYTCADMTKIQNTAINLKLTSLEDAVNDYVKNYLSKNLTRI